MNDATPRLRDFAQRLIAIEAMETKSSATKPPTAFAVLKKIRPHLAEIVGEAGFRSILSRSLVRAGAGAQAHLNPVDPFESLGELETKLGPKKIADIQVVLLAELFGLLIGLIGEALTLRLVRHALPNCPETF